MTDRKTRLWPWIVALLIGLPLLYELSLGPWLWLAGHQDFPLSLRLWIIRITPTYAAPSNFLYNHAPESVQRVMAWYIGLWITPP